MVGDFASLRHLSRLNGVQPDYRDNDGVLRRARPEALLAALDALGVALEDPQDASAAARACLLDRCRAGLPPVVCSWVGGMNRLAWWCPAEQADEPVNVRLGVESGEVRRWTLTPPEMPVIGRRAAGTKVFVRRVAKLPADLPVGYHRLQLQVRGDRPSSAPSGSPWHASAHLFHAPPRARGLEFSRESAWGVLEPTYALAGGRWSIGDLRQLASFGDWVGRAGGGVAATLPLLAAFLDEPFEPSPYSPVSRLFWNEIFLAPEWVDGLSTSVAVDGGLAGEGKASATRQSEFVDYAAVARAKRSRLEPAALRMLATGGGPADFQRFLDEVPDARDYARFRAITETRRQVWSLWPERLGEDEGLAASESSPAEAYHLFVQWQMDRQLRRVARELDAGGVSLYLDLPLGVHPDGYDAWRYRDLFAAASAGAPPDPFFTGGQNWGFRPLHPRRIREDGHRYFRGCIARHLAISGMLRLDHVMWLHRLYWIPAGASATDGVYVRYPAPELYAVLTIESARHDAAIVGEDLGTVPRAVRKGMARHGLHRMYAVQFEASATAERPLQPVVPGAVASLNTHDMPTFAGFWNGDDVRDRVSLGLLDEEGAEAALNARRRLRRALTEFLIEESESSRIPAELGAEEARDALLEYLARSDAGVVLASLEDLWLAREPHNVPGTWRERPNWRRRSPYTLGEIDELPGIRRTLDRIRNARKEGMKDGSRRRDED